MAVLFALLAFGLFGMAALTIDMGLVTLARVQLQNAADSASLEGLRGRNPNEVTDAFKHDCLRRSSAARVVAWTFGTLEAANDNLQLGAGPNMVLSGGLGPMNASQLLSVPDPRVYEPILQRNQAENVPQGDMVSGAFVSTLETNPEASDYVRTDFVPTPAVPPDGSGLASCPPDDDFSGATISDADPMRDPSFLVRLRRGNDFDGLDNVTAVSSSGTPVPLLFGRGTLIHPEDPDAGYSVRHHGFAVRGTAIAHERPVMQVGMGVAGLSAIPFALNRSFWEHPCWDADARTAVSIDAGTGAITGQAPCAGIPAGAFVAAPLTSIGELAVAAPPAASTARGYAALVQVMATSGLPRVVGFGLVDLAAGVLEKLPNRIAPANATAHAPSGLPAGFLAADPLEVAEVLEANRSLSDETTSVRRTLFAPAVAR